MSKNNNNDNDKADFSPLSFVFMVICAFLVVRSISPTAAQNMDEYFSVPQSQPQQVQP